MAHGTDDIAVLEQTPMPLAATPSTYSLIQQSANRFPDLPALSAFRDAQSHAVQQRWSYAQLLDDITRAANFFRHQGIERQGVVACITPNLPETHLAMWGAETAGIAFAVNPALDGEQMAALLRAAKVSCIVTCGPSIDPQIWQRVVAAVAGLPALTCVVAISTCPDDKRDTPSQATEPMPKELSGIPLLDFHEALRTQPGDQLTFPAPASDDIAAYFCTGGTTGLPKIALHSHGNEVAVTHQLAASVGPDVFAPGNTVLTALPLFHVNAQLGTGLTVLATGGHILLAPPAGYRSPGLIPRFWEIIARYRVTAFSGVPTIFAGLLQVPTAGHDLSSLKVAICGAAPMPVELFKHFEAATGLRILEG